MESVETLHDIELINQIPVVPTILEVICQTTGMGFAAIARVTEKRWIACAVKDDIQFGLRPGGELQIETTICDEIRNSGEAVVIDHVDEDEHFSRHHTPAMYGFQSYISVPIRLKDGSFFGTLCSIDPRPAKLDTPEIRGMFSLFADLIGFHLGAIVNSKQTELKLSEERRIAELREQFIAILGHDLRTPVGAVLSSAQILLRSDPNEHSRRFLQIIQDSSYRMKELVENMLDFARGRLGDGITINQSEKHFTEETLIEVISEFKAIHPERIIHTSFEFNDLVKCDSRRIAQLFSNLLSNAITYGDRTLPIKVFAGTVAQQLVISVSNAGEKIREETLQKLFQPFSRGELQQDQKGLGLGLYIASEIARAHGGKIAVESTEQQTCFTLKIPAVQP